MQEFILVAEKLFIGFLALIFVINISGKGNLAPSTASDAVQNQVLGGIIGGVIYNDNIKIWEYLAILAIWCGLVLLLRYVKMHNVKMKQILDGIALPVVDEGAILYDNCKKLGLSAHDLSFKLRTNRVYSVTEVKRAVCEQNGQLIIVKYGEENPKFPLITDGHLQKNILTIIEKDKEWLQEELKKQGYQSVHDVYLGEYNKGELKLFPYKSQRMLKIEKSFFSIMQTGLICGENSSVLLEESEAFFCEEKMLQ